MKFSVNGFLNKLLIAGAILFTLIVVFNEVRDDIVFTVEEVVTVHDGDTFTILYEGKEQSVRFRGIDTPELHKPQCTRERFLATQAQAFVEEQVRNAQRVTLLDVDKNGDRYGRWLAWVYVDGENLADMTARAGLGRPYDGGKRQSWCHDPSAP